MADPKDTNLLKSQEPLPSNYSETGIDIDNDTMGFDFDFSNREYRRLFNLDDPGVSENTVSLDPLNSLEAREEVDEEEVDLLTDGRDGSIQSFLDENIETNRTPLLDEFWGIVDSSIAEKETYNSASRKLANKYIRFNNELNSNILGAQKTLAQSNPKEYAWRSKLLDEQYSAGVAYLKKLYDKPLAQDNSGLAKLITPPVIGDDLSAEKAQDVFNKWLDSVDVILRDNKLDYLSNKRTIDNLIGDISLEVTGAISSRAKQERKNLLMRQSLTDLGFSPEDADYYGGLLSTLDQKVESGLNVAVSAGATVTEFGADALNALPFVEGLEGFSEDVWRPTSDTSVNFDGPSFQRQLAEGILQSGFQLGAVGLGFALGGPVGAGVAAGTIGIGASVNAANENADRVYRETGDRDLAEQVLYSSENLTQAVAQGGLETIGSLYAGGGQALAQGTKQIFKQMSKSPKIQKAIQVALKTKSKIDASTAYKVLVAAEGGLRRSRGKIADVTRRASDAVASTGALGRAAVGATRATGRVAGAVGQGALGVGRVVAGQTGGRATAKSYLQRGGLARRGAIAEGSTEFLQEGFGAAESEDIFREATNLPEQDTSEYLETFWEGGLIAALAGGTAGGIIGARQQRSVSRTLDQIANNVEGFDPSNKEDTEAVLSLLFDEPVVSQESPQPEVVESNKVPPVKDSSIVDGQVPPGGSDVDINVGEQIIQEAIAKAQPAPQVAEDIVDKQEKMRFYEWVDPEAYDRLGEQDANLVVEKIERDANQSPVETLEVDQDVYSEEVQPDVEVVKIGRPVIPIDTTKSTGEVTTIAALNKELSDLTNTEVVVADLVKEGALGLRVSGPAGTMVQLGKVTVPSQRTVIDRSSANDPNIVSHEIGHDLDKRNQISDKIINKVNNREDGWQQTLRDLSKYWKHGTSSKKIHTKVKEGVAEAFRHYMWNPNSVSPEIATYFTEALQKEGTFDQFNQFRNKLISHLLTSEKNGTLDSSLQQDVKMPDRLTIKDIKSVAGLGVDPAKRMSARSKLINSLGSSIFDDKFFVQEKTFSAITDVMARIAGYEKNSPDYMELKANSPATKEVQNILSGQSLVEGALNGYMVDFASENRTIVSPTHHGNISQLRVALAYLTPETQEDIVEGENSVYSRAVNYMSFISAAETTLHKMKQLAEGKIVVDGKERVRGITQEALEQFNELRATIGALQARTHVALQNNPDYQFRQQDVSRIIDGTGFIDVQINAPIRSDLEAARFSNIDTETAGTLKDVISLTGITGRTDFVEEGTGEQISKKQANIEKLTSRLKDFTDKAKIDDRTFAKITASHAAYKNHATGLLKLLRSTGLLSNKEFENITRQGLEYSRLARVLQVYLGEDLEAGSSMMESREGSVRSIKDPFNELSQMTNRILGRVFINEYAKSAGTMALNAQGIFGEKSLEQFIGKKAAQEYSITNKKDIPIKVLDFSRDSAEAKEFQIRQSKKQGKGTTAIPYFNKNAPKGRKGQLPPKGQLSKRGFVIFTGEQLSQEVDRTFNQRQGSAYPGQELLGAARKWSQMTKIVGLNLTAVKLAISGSYEAIARVPRLQLTSKDLFLESLRELKDPNNIPGVRVAKAVASPASKAELSDFQRRTGVQVSQLIEEINQVKMTPTFTDYALGKAAHNTELLDFITELKKDPKQFLLQAGTSYNTNETVAERAFRNFEDFRTGKNTKASNWVKDYYSRYLHRFASAAEATNRINNYERTYNRLKSQGVSERASRLLAMKSANDLADFRRVGQSVKAFHALSGFMPQILAGRRSFFLNLAQNGSKPKELLKEFTRMTASLAPYILLLDALEEVSRLMFDDEEETRSRSGPEYQKRRAWKILLPQSIEDTIGIQNVWIPKGFEENIIADFIELGTTDLVKGDLKQEAMRFLGNSFHEVVDPGIMTDRPPVSLAVLGDLISTGFNTRTFPETDNIVPEYEVGTPLSKRRTDNASALSRGISRGADWFTQELDYLAGVDSNSVVRATMDPRQIEQYYAAIGGSFAKGVLGTSSLMESMIFGDIEQLPADTIKILKHLSAGMLGTTKDNIYNTPNKDELEYLMQKYDISKSIRAYKNITTRKKQLFKEARQSKFAEISEANIAISNQEKDLIRRIKQYEARGREQGLYGDELVEYVNRRF